ncbi:MAG: GntR family transcriptional regulator, partial [Phycisphaeraceae bacterium]|nr:GntR family transcriptional regulator [Phycisphaeraceae bacterium]
MADIYQQLCERIFHDFWQQSEVHVGLKLPTERELEVRYKVSRPTVGKAIAALAAEGWVTKRQGSGIFVAAIESEAGKRGSGSPFRIGFVGLDLGSELCHRVFVGVEQIVRLK